MSSFLCADCIDRTVPGVVLTSHHHHVATVRSIDETLVVDYEQSMNEDEAWRSLDFWLNSLDIHREMLLWFVDLVYVSSHAECIGLSGALTLYL